MSPETIDLRDADDECVEVPMPNGLLVQRPARMGYPAATVAAAVMLGIYVALPLTLFVDAYDRQPAEAATIAGLALAFAVAGVVWVVRRIAMAREDSGSERTDP